MTNVISQKTKIVNSQNDNPFHELVGYTPEMNGKSSEQHNRYQAFISVVERRLEEKGWTDADLNRAAGYTHPYINKVRERGSMPKLEHLQRLAKALDIDPAAFVQDPNKAPMATDLVGAAITLLGDVDLLEGALKVALPIHGLDVDRARQIATTAVSMMQGLKEAGVNRPAEEHWRLAARIPPA